MAELTTIEQAILKALEDLGATNEKSIKTADDIMKKANRPKGLSGT